MVNYDMIHEFEEKIKLLKILTQLQQFGEVNCQKKLEKIEELDDYLSNYGIEKPVFKEIKEIDICKTKYNNIK